MTMTAVDYDDPNEGSNAKLTYSIEKNVIDENTGMPIFEIESETGVIKTAVPGLDREKTPDYSIQVVAMDGGGLKGNVAPEHLPWTYLTFCLVIWSQELERRLLGSRISTTCRRNSPNQNGTPKWTKRTASHYRTLPSWPSLFTMKMKPTNFITRYLVVTKLAPLSLPDWETSLTRESFIVACHP